MKDELLTNFIPINRRLFEHHLWCEEREYSRFEAWLYLLKEARFEDTKLISKGKLVLIKRGQVYVSYRFLANAFGWTVKRVRTFLDLIESDKMIDRYTAKDTGQTIITICNYDKYNIISDVGGTEKGTQRAHRGHTEGTKSNKENKENKEILSNDSTKKEPNVSSCTQSDFDKFNEWLKSNAPYCANPKHLSQITESQFEKLKETYTSNQIADMVLQIENRKDLRKRYSDLYRTVLNWLKKEQVNTKTTNNDQSQQKTDTNFDGLRIIG